MLSGGSSETRQIWRILLFSGSDLVESHGEPQLGVDPFPNPESTLGNGRSSNRLAARWPGRSDIASAYSGERSKARGPR